MVRREGEGVVRSKGGGGSGEKQRRGEGVVRSRGEGGSGEN